MEVNLAVAYWAARKETLFECSSRASLFLQTLSDVAPELSGWRKLGNSKKQALANEIINVKDQNEILQLLLDKGVKRTFDKDLVQELGFLSMLWNGQEDDFKTTNISMSCGMFSSVIGLVNSVVLKIPYCLNDTLISALKPIANTFVDAWEPDWMAITSQEKLNECVSKHGKLTPFLDKALYIKSNLECPYIPDGIYEEKLEHGRLFLTNTLPPIISDVD